MMNEGARQESRRDPPPAKRRRRPLVGYVIAGGLGWLLVVYALILAAPHFLTMMLVSRQGFILLVVGYLLGGTIYHLLWGKRIRFGLRGLLAAVFVVAVLCTVALYWEHLPGTLHFDHNGFPHGTGTRHYYYDSGELMMESHFRAGVPTRSTWYKPTGEVIATTIWKKDRVNVGYSLYQDGSIMTKMEAVYDPELRLYVGAENGDRIDYAPDGSIEREFRDWKEVAKESRGVVESREKATAARN